MSEPRPQILRQLWVDAFVRENERQDRIWREVDKHWPHPAPKGCRCIELAAAQEEQREWK